jgi:hypothetical protein
MLASMDEGSIAANVRSDKLEEFLRIIISDLHFIASGSQMSGGSTIADTSEWKALQEHVAEIDKT